MKLRHVNSHQIFFAIITLTMLMMVAIVSSAQMQSPPPPPPPPPAANVAPVVPASNVAPAKVAEIEGFLLNGKISVRNMDLTSARLYFEQAFAKSDEYQVKGSLLAKTYMALGSLYVGFFQQVPQGTEFIKMALSIDSSVKPEPELHNDAVDSVFNATCQAMGIAGVSAPLLQQPASQANASNQEQQFWIMKHLRLIEAKRMYPLGVYVDANPMVAIKEIRFFFRLPTDRNYQSINMNKNGSMFGILVNCDSIALLDPELIYYYIEIIGGDGTIIASEGSANNPIEVKMIAEESFLGEQPNLPGMEPHAKCDPDEAAPCPPWAPNCHETACFTSEDCIGNAQCVNEYCQEVIVNTDEQKFKGLMFSLGMGTGLGLVTGSEKALVGDSQIDLALGLNSAPLMFRLNMGYFLNDNFVLGLFVRSQLPAFAGDPENEDDFTFGKGLMWGPTLSWFFYGDGRALGPGQPLNEDGDLKDKPGFRLYARGEFNIYGSMWHSVALKSDDENDTTVKYYRLHESGHQAIGLGTGALYGVNRNIDIGMEVMWDLIIPSPIANNFDIQFLVSFHL